VQSGKAGRLYLSEPQNPFSGFQLQLGWLAAAGEKHGLMFAAKYSS
jgi:hypothetical protein